MTTTAPKYPAIRVKLTGTDGNAYALMGRVAMAMKKAKIDQSEISQFRAEATSGDYNNLLRTCAKWVNAV